MKSLRRASWVSVLGLIPLLSIPVAQGPMFPGPGTPNGGGGGGGTAFNLGQPIASITDSPDSGNGLGIVTICLVTPTPSSGSISVTGEGTFTASVVAANWGMNVYVDAGGGSSCTQPDGGAEVSGCATFSSSTPATPLATLSVSGCTLASNKAYWIAFVTVSNTQEQLISAGQCSNGTYGFAANSLLGSFNSAGDWPSTFPVSDGGGDRCHANYLTVNYTSTATYNVVSSGIALGVGAYVAPTASGHGMVTLTGYSGSGGIYSSMSDSASDSIPSRGSCPNNIGAAQTGLCIASIDRVAAGITSITPTFSVAPDYVMVGYQELSGTKAVGSFDQAAYDAAVQGATFTSATTGTTTQPAEILFGLAYFNNAAAGGSPDFSATGSWTIPPQYSLYQNGVSQVSLANYRRTVSSTGTYNLTGSANAAGTFYLTGLATFK